MHGMSSGTAHAAGIDGGPGLHGEEAAPRQRYSVGMLTRCAPLLLLMPLVSAQEGSDQLRAFLEGGPHVASDGSALELLPLTLEQAVELALRANLDLERAAVEVEVAQAGARGAWGTFDWDLTGAVSYSSDQRPGSNVFEAGSIEDEVRNGNLSLRRALSTGGRFAVDFNVNNTVTNSPFAVGDRFTRDGLSMSFTQPLARGAWREYATATQRERELEWTRTVESRRGSRQDLVRRVQLAYWDLVAAGEQWTVSVSSLELGLELLAKRERELEAGIGTEVEVLQAQAEVATRLEAGLLARNELQKRADDLKLVVLGDPASELWTRALVAETGLPPQVDASDVPSWADAMLVALENRSDLRVQRVGVETARLGLLRAESERLAGVDLEVSASSNGQSTDPSQALDDTLGFEFPGWSVRLTYNMPIGNRTANQAVIAAEGRVRLARIDQQRSEMAAVAEVRDAVRQVRYRAEAVRAAETSLRLAELQLEAEQARYDEGLSTNFQVLEFQRDLVEARRGERQARVEYVKARTQLLAAQGLLDGERAQ